MSKLETPVMLLFFNRPDVLEQTFEWVRSVKPKQLFLVQDGARENRPDDIENIEKCRKIVENIDWECDVKKNYSEKNLSCDEREFSGIDWCFQFVDRLIIIEDDCKPVDSFYDFCGEMLEKYKDDERIYRISGFTRMGVYDKTPYDYVISSAGAGLGWATWKRAWEQVKEIKGWDFLNDPDLMGYYEKFLTENYGSYYENIVERAKTAKANDDKKGIVTSWETYISTTMCLNNGLVITPSRNMISYIGVSKNATHSYDDVNLLPRKIRKMLTQDAFEMAFPIKHPPFVVRDTMFEEMEGKVFKPGKRLAAHIESAWLKVIHGRWDLIFAALKKKLGR